MLLKATALELPAQNRKKNIRNYNYSDPQSDRKVLVHGVVELFEDCWMMIWQGYVHVSCWWIFGDAKPDLLIIRYAVVWVLIFYQKMLNEKNSSYRLTVYNEVTCSCRLFVFRFMPPTKDERQPTTTTSFFVLHHGSSRSENGVSWRHCTFSWK